MCFCVVMEQRSGCAEFSLGVICLKNAGVIFFFSEFILQAYSFEFVGEEGCVLLSDGQYGGAVCQADLCAAEASHFVLCYHVGAVDADELFGGQCALHGFHVGAGEYVGAVHAYVEEDYVGLLFHDGLEARVGFAEGLQRYAALARAEVLDDEEGQVLFVIDQVPYRAALETALADVKSAEAKLKTARLTARSKEQLFKEKVVSDFDLQTANNSLLEAEAALAQAKAEVTNARNNLSYTEVKSPVDGVASMIPYRIGALVSSAITEPLVTVSDDSEVYAYFSMAENQMIDLVRQYGSLARAKEEMPEVGLTMSNGAAYGSKGRIDAISGTVDQGTGAVSLRAVYPNPDHLLRDGGSASVIVPTVHKACISIPQSATYELQNKIFVWKVVDGKTKSAPISVYK